MFHDASGKDISKDSFGTDYKGRKFKVLQTVQREDWITAKWLQTKDAQKPNFIILSLEFDPESGQIVGGEATIEKVHQKIPLTPVALDDEDESKAREDQYFEGEKPFKLKFNAKDKDVKATI